jgi:peptide chain release factor 2
MSKKDFWDDPQKAQDILKQAKVYRDKIEQYEKLIIELEELETMVLFIEEGDNSFSKELIEGIETLENKIENIKIEVLLKGEYDRCNAIISIHTCSGVVYDFLGFKMMQKIIHCGKYGLVAIFDGMYAQSDR